MSEESTEPAHGRDGFAASVLQNVVGALVLIALSAGVFWAIGSFGGEDGDVVVADAPEPEPVEPAEDDADAEATDEGDADPDAAGDEATDDTDEAADADGDADTDADSDDDADAADEAEQDEAADDDEATDEDADDADRIDAGSISVQVLDGYQADGGTAASATAEELRDLGYQVVAENPAVRYDVTTVLYTGDAVAEGEQVAADLGATEVRQQSGLSTAVQVHVVVGADRG